jgi:hypothetical protein
MKKLLSVDLAEAREVNEDGTNEWELTNFDAERRFLLPWKLKWSGCTCCSRMIFLILENQEAEFECITRSKRGIWVQ